MIKKEKLSTSSLEESGELGSFDAGEARSPYGKALSETVTTHVVFEKGELIVIQRDGKTVFSKYYPRSDLNGEERNRNGI